MSNLRPRAASRLSVTLLDPHSAPALGTSLPPSEPPPEGGGLVVPVVLGAGRVVVGAGRVVVVVVVVVVVAGLVVVGVVDGPPDDTSVDPGSWNHGSVASLPNPWREAAEVPTRQSQTPLDSA